MKFVLLDRITQVERGKLIRAEKNLTLGEEYLADHFPGFPVMPGVLILESMVQTSAWLERITSDFQHSMVLLKEVKAVRYKGFVSPGQTLVIESNWQKSEEQETTFKCEGFINGKSCCNAKIVLKSFNLVDRDGDAARDEALINQYRKMLTTLHREVMAVV